ncbi:hypothetical protein [Micromonospora sp. CB01531]|uniref:hypothetical protein n=1 Tax=Micromonospora sp. CB01531 TaxID=1718947 RepID=UPI00093FDE78|nr:hypothetical protein [Micromonospora sp. CB01531]OKI54541.1 hypothetical protein A6A27_31950 [Micromonospora sp. CB01531]
MGNFEETFKGLLARYLTKYHDDAIEVIDYEQDTEAGGYCETCYYEDTVVRIKYISAASGDRRQFTYYGDMGELIRCLTSFEEEDQAK